MRTGPACLVAIGAMLAAGIGVPQIVQAQSLGAQATVSVTDGPGIEECMPLNPRLEVCGLLGVRKATVSWSTACAPRLGDDGRMTKVKLVARPPCPTESEYLSVGGSDEFGDVSLPASGSATFPLLPGWTVAASALVTCTDWAAVGVSPEERGFQAEPQPPAEQAAAESAAISAPPRLVGLMRTGGTYCIRPPQTPQSVIGKLQAGQTSWVRLYVRYGTYAQHPIWGDPSRAPAGAGDYARVRLYARGAGINVKVRPDRFWLKHDALEMKVRPKKAGTLRMWAVVDGVRTNAKTIRVLRGCR